MAQKYAEEHAEKAQGRYVARYNLRAREKSFKIGDQVLILTPDSTSSKLSRDGLARPLSRTKCRHTVIW